MPKFKFELEPVLRMRRRQEEERQRAVAELERQRAGIEDRIRSQQATISASKQDLRRMLAGERAGAAAGVESGVSLRGAKLQANAALHMVVQTQRSVVELAGVHGRLDVARLALLKAMTQRKAVETLKQKRYDEWRAEILRKEQAEVDDMVNARVARAMGERRAAEPGSEAAS